MTTNVPAPDIISQCDKKNIVFISTMAGASWGGSEELWSQTAVRLLKDGFSVSASVVESSPLHERVQHMRATGLPVQVRPRRYALWARAWNLLTSRGTTMVAVQVGKLLRTMQPNLVVFSDGLAYPPIELIELCIAKNIRFVTIAQANSDCFWLDDMDAKRYRVGFAAALRCYFVSRENQRLVEKQIGCEVSNAELVWNPYNIDQKFPAPWPTSGQEGELRLASVARLHPPSKGQDILLEALASPTWANCTWHLTLYGEGPMRDILERLTRRLDLTNRVTFAGYVPVEEIWTSNHVLVMPSRYEGLPLAIIEAMLCGRPVIATDIAGHPEVIADGLTGFLAGPPSIRTLAVALERLWLIAETSKKWAWPVPQQ